MSYSIALLSLLPLARGVAFGGPAPTGTATNADRAVDGWSPKPTNGPSVAELRRRQSNLYPETCGWIDGDYSSGVTCNIGRTCMLYTASDVAMAGCCDGSDTQECGWANSCVDYDAYTSSSCDSDCMFNTFIRKCSDSASPYCVTWTYPSDGVADYGCADYSSGVETVYQEAFDTLDSYTTSMTLPTLSGDAVTAYNGESATSDIDTTSDDLDIFSDLTTSTETDGTEATSFPSSGGGSSSSRKKKGVSVGLIVGAVVGGLVVLFLIVAAIIFICVKKKKSRQLAANQQAIAAAQANRPQSQYPPQYPPQQPQMYQQPPVAPMPMQSPPPQQNGYFAPPGVQDQKLNPQTQVHEYGNQTPISNPTSPAPAYVQPYYAAPNAPPMPTQSPAPHAGSHEVSAVTAPHPQAAPSQPSNVYEMGSAR